MSYCNHCGYISGVHGMERRVQMLASHLELPILGNAIPSIMTMTAYIPAKQVGQHPPSIED